MLISISFSPPSVLAIYFFWVRDFVKMGNFLGGCNSYKSGCWKFSKKIAKKKKKQGFLEWGWLLASVATPQKVKIKKPYFFWQLKKAFKIISIFRILKFEFLFFGKISTIKKNAEGGAS
jgi:hypothetical protein